MQSAFLVATAALLIPTFALSQGYPKVDPQLQKATDEKKAAADQRAKERHAAQEDQIEFWARNGKPSISSALNPGDLPQAMIPAFPGAWGGGMYSFGGRGGKVIVVTSLADSGPGSLRDACETVGPRIVVFNVAGIIRLKDKLSIRAPYLTLAGNTAPGDGVCIAGATVEIDTHDIVIRHMRFRRGETDVTDRNDSFGGNPVGNIIIDHVSASWGLDENMSLYRHMHTLEGGKAVKLPTVNITIQNSIISECLNTYHHAFGSTIGGLNSTFHHNLWANNSGRDPSVGMYGDFTFANNVIYNWGHRSIDGGDHRSIYTILNNYFKPGPATPDSPVRFRVLKPESNRDKGRTDEFGKAYVSGNVVDGNDRVSKDNWDGGVQPDCQRPLEAVLSEIRVNQPCDHAPFPLQNAKDAYVSVLSKAGACLPKRDVIDTRVVQSVSDGVSTAKVLPETRKQLVQAPYKESDVDKQLTLISKGIITHPDQVGGYPEYRGTPYADGDGDGMPDSWESTHGLDPKNPKDATTDLNGDGYTNIEDFINGLDPSAAKVDWKDLTHNVDRLDKPRLTSPSSDR